MAVSCSYGCKLQVVAFGNSHTASEAANGSWPLGPYPAVSLAEARVKKMLGVLQDVERNGTYETTRRLRATIGSSL